MFTLTLDDFKEARARSAQHIKHTRRLTSRQLSERTGLDVRMKAEMFQRVGSYKIRGPLNKFALMAEEKKKRGVVCSSAGNHAQGVALAAKIHWIRAVVCTARSGTRPTRRQKSWCARRGSPTCTPSTTKSSSRGRALSASRSCRTGP